MVGTRAALVVAAFASLSVTLATPPTNTLYKRSNLADNAPYAPDLFSRAELQEEEESFEKRQAYSKRPYAPELFSRSLLEEDEGESDFALRSQLQHGQMFYSSNEVSGCSKECSDSQFCSFATGICQDKLAIKSVCNENSACLSGYCGPKGRCAAKKDLGVKCSPGLHHSCASDYCSVTSNTCKIKQSVGGACLVTSGCQQGLSCINKQCHEFGAVMTPRKRSLEDLPEEISKRTFTWGPKPSGYNFPAWMRKREVAQDEQEPTKRWLTWGPSPSGYGKPVWMHKRENDQDKREVTPHSSSVEEPTKRTFNWGSYPSGYGKPIWMKRTEVEKEAVVEKREMNTTPSNEEAPSKRTFKPSPSGYFYPIPLYPYN